MKPHHQRTDAPAKSGETRTTVGSASGVHSKEINQRDATGSAANGKASGSCMPVILAEKRRSSKLPLQETTPERIAALTEIPAAVPGHSPGYQRTILLTSLRRHGLVSVPEVSVYGGMGDPRPRKHELKKAGIPIEMMRVAYFDGTATLRKCGAYHLEIGRGAA